MYKHTVSAPVNTHIVPFPIATWLGFVLALGKQTARARSACRVLVSVSTHKPHSSALPPFTCTTLGSLATLRWALGLPAEGLFSSYSSWSSRVLGAGWKGVNGGVDTRTIAAYGTRLCLAVCGTGLERGLGSGL